MTEKEKSALSRGQLLFCIMSVVAIVLTFRYSDLAISAMSQGMSLCAKTVIPSLFPFMVLSELLVASGASELFGRYIAFPFGKLFALSRDGSAVFLLGILCGFPVAATSAISLYRRGRINRGELMHILLFCNNPSSAFLISAVGGGLFGSRDFGVLLYIVHLISSFALGLIGRALFSKEKKKGEFCTLGAVSKHRGGVIERFTIAVKDSAQSMLFICAFIVFFSAIAGVLQYFAKSVSLPDFLAALCTGFFEMTGGVSAAAKLPRSQALFVAAAITGWSGLSVHFQFVGVCGESRVPLRPYFLSKIFSSLFNAAAVGIFVELFGDRLSFSSASSSPSVLLFAHMPAAVITLAVFLLGCAGKVKEMRRK